MALHPLALENFAAAVEQVDRLGLRDERARAELISSILWENHRRQTKHELHGGIDLPPDKLRVTVQQETVDGPLTAALRSWRTKLAKSREIPPYTILHDKTLLAIAEVRPTTNSELSRIRGIGAYKAKLYGPDVLALVAAHSSNGTMDDEQPTKDQQQASIHTDQKKIVSYLRRQKRATSDQIFEHTDAELAALIKLEESGRVKKDAAGFYRLVKRAATS